MRVFKFGGASVKNAAAVKNVADILREYGHGPLVIVISAMGKTTNALEEIFLSYRTGGQTNPKIASLREWHLDIINDLFANGNRILSDEIDNMFLSLELYFSKEIDSNYDLVYDQVVCYGELISTKIVSAYLNHVGYKNKWVDARNFIITNDLYRDARIDLDVTATLIERKIPGFTSSRPVITQGFIGSTKDNFTTTLGREGSDFTASIFAYALNAEELVIWKDVPGIMNADPGKFPDTVKFDKLSYEQAVEMTYYGASVLHPKTIKPIENKGIPLHVKSFIHPELTGTYVTGDASVNTGVPIIILKEKQLLLSLCTRDFSFIAEENINKIFQEVVNQGMKVNLMQNTAISFQICIDDREIKVERFK
ncbi:MAG: aspartate kinase, partial [Bacteroidota bacterium]|nr:aspartate kinase [Bacteroidota bacterium]